MTFPTPHLDKLNKTLENSKLPESDIPQVKETIEYYKKWIENLKNLSTAEIALATTEEENRLISKMTNLLQDYKNYVELKLIFESNNDFLYRQKGQLKLDNSIIEEFIPYLIYPFITDDLKTEFNIGPKKCFSSMYFTGSFNTAIDGGGMKIRNKDQDFSISRKVYLKSSLKSDFSESNSINIYLAHIAAELKTNLDKTMFQEASATAHDVKMSVSGAKYFLLCDWLDMTPISTAATDINEVIILRGKRISSNIRKHFSSVKGRKDSFDNYKRYLEENPYRSESFIRFKDHIISSFNDENPIEESVLERGYF
ncbi:MAG: Bpu10I family restriction endonuclease [Armatimonadetes bacterium]|nr:Bpu10I family restriction endonuclease [Armatimonadota bacterium]